MEIKITAVKFETVNGKKTGRSFSFPLDPKKMAEKCKTEATLKKQVEEYVAKSGVFQKEELKDVKYSMKEFLEEWHKQLAVVKAEMLARLEASENRPESRVTPNSITRLAENEVFVFGSNGQGKHYGGAAKFAHLHFGAIMGQGHGPQGRCYAIDSMSGMPQMAKDISEFCEYAKKHPEKHFYVTPIGCGIAGFKPSKIAPYFEMCREIENVSLPTEFWNVLGAPQSPSPSKYFDLERFITAQNIAYPIALEEMRRGRKTTHWMWYIFPQQKGLGHSHNSNYYGMEGIEEAKAYMEHPILAARLREICQALLTHAGKLTIDQIMGSNIDVLKLQTSMNLFNKVAPNDVFLEVLEKFY